jgi:hypothetical protein
MKTIQMYLMKRAFNRILAYVYFYILGELANYCMSLDLDASSLII